MTEDTDETPSIDDLDEFHSLVNQNGLVKLFANRTRARIITTLVYADEFLTVKEIANGANISQTAVHEATDELEKFDFLDKQDSPDEQASYRIQRDDPLTQEILTLAESATNRYYR